MSEEQLKAFFAKVQADTNIQARLKEAKSPDDVVAIAKEHGHHFSSEHVTQLSDEDLKSISGGSNLCASMFCNWQISLSQKPQKLLIRNAPRTTNSILSKSQGDSKLAIIMTAKSPEDVVGIDKE